MPFESSYYPFGGSRRQAQVLDVLSTGIQLTGKNLTVGKPVSFRNVVVWVRFPDGAPMSSAEVDAIGEPVEEGGIPWELSSYASKRGIARFSAPSNRKLRIEIRDAYGRDLKGQYLSSYPAGAGAIRQEFVVLGQE